MVTKLPFSRIKNDGTISKSIEIITAFKSNRFFLISPYLFAENHAFQREFELFLGTFQKYSTNQLKEVESVSDF